MSDDPFAQPLATTMTKVSNDNAFGTGSIESDDAGAFMDNNDFSSIGM